MFVVMKLTNGALKGNKLITPFGALASILQTDSFRKGLQNVYPGIDGDDPAKRSHATCDFIRDFVLELKPLDTKPAYEIEDSSKDRDQLKAKSDVIDDKRDVELAQTSAVRMAK